MERKKTALSRFFDVIGGVENVVLAIMVVGMIFTILVQIIGRVIGHPFPWTEETSRYLFLWMMFVALAALTRRNLPVSRCLWQRGQNG